VHVEIGSHLIAHVLEILAESLGGVEDFVEDRADIHIHSVAFHIILPRPPSRGAALDAEVPASFRPDSVVY
jgi:hypothetical protein